tara:strand:- start:1942 stop:2181 length:240 start_codon:yes stop_codon:yes gene_type:complete
MSIQQEITFKSSANKVYKAITDSKQFSDVTGAPAEIQPVNGREFKCFGGMITGYTVEIEPYKLLVQVELGERYLFFDKV